MAEYIEREALIKRLEVTPLLRFGIPSIVRDGVIDLAKKQPAADVVEVCRCRDCRHSRPLNRNDWLESLYADDCIWCMRLSNGMRKTDFCSDGERRENDERIYKQKSSYGIHRQSSKQKHKQQ